MVGHLDPDRAFARHGSYDTDTQRFEAQSNVLFESFDLRDFHTRSRNDLIKGNRGADRRFYLAYLDAEVLECLHNAVTVGLNLLVGHLHPCAVVCKDALDLGLAVGRKLAQGVVEAVFNVVIGHFNVATFGLQHLHPLAVGGNYPTRSEGGFRAVRMTDSRFQFHYFENAVGSFRNYRTDRFYRLFDLDYVAASDVSHHKLRVGCRRDMGYRRGCRSGFVGPGLRSSLRLDRRIHRSFRCRFVLETACESVFAAIVIPLVIAFILIVVVVEVVVITAMLVAPTRTGHQLPNPDSTVGNSAPHAVHARDVFAAYIHGKQYPQAHQREPSTGKSNHSA